MSTIPRVTVNASLSLPASPSAASVEEPHQRGASFHGLCRELEFASYGSFDEIVLSVPEEEVIGNVLRHWRIGEKVYFFDLLALEILQGLEAHPDLVPEFIDLYRECVLCSEFENLKLEPFRFDHHKPQLAAFRSKMIGALMKSLGADRDPARVNEIKRIDLTFQLFVKFLESPLTRRLLTGRSLVFYYEQAPIDSFSKDQQAVYLNFLRALSPLVNRELDPGAFRKEPPSQFYRRISAVYDIIHDLTKRLAHRVKEKGWTKEDAIKMGSLNFSVRRVGGLKFHFEGELLRKDGALIETRGLESLRLYCNLRDFAKGRMDDPFQAILKKIEAKLGPDFDGVLNRMLEKGKLDPWMRDLSCFSELRSIMALVKREIKLLHAQASAGTFGDPREIEEDYRDCFDAFSSLFVALHDMVATQNANYDQLKERHLPDDLVACAVLVSTESPSPPSESPAPSLDDLEEAPPQPALPSPALQDQLSLMPAASTALLPVPEEAEAPPLPSPTQVQAAETSRRKTRSLGPADPYERKERGPSPAHVREFNIPNPGAKPGKVGQFLLSQGFHLSKVDNHRYYTHSDVRVKISSHDTLSPGVRQEILRALRTLSEMGALE